MSCIKVAISGVQGYVGKELINLIAHHPNLILTAVHAKQSAKEVYKQYPSLQVPVYDLQQLIQHSADIDVVLLATPAAVSMEIAKALIGKGPKIIDLSGAFRLPQEQFNQWYEIPHQAPELIAQSCYGLTPWVTNQDQYQLIANPGCYANCALMSLIPLLKANLISTDSIIIDAKSGASGAGKQNNNHLMFCELSDNFLPYKIGKHQHTPEIIHALAQIACATIKLRFNTSLLPIVRGISMTIYAQTNACAKAIGQAYAQAYQDYPLVQFHDLSSEDSPFILSLKNVVNTPKTHIGYLVQGSELTVFSCIDNLLKGAASQAIENVQAIFGLEEQL